MESTTTDVLTQPTKPHHGRHPNTFDETCGMLSTCFVIFAVMIGYYHAYAHTREKSKTMEDRLMTRIIFAAPIYALYSLLLTYKEAYDEYMYVIRDCYGAYVVYGFLGLGYMYIGGEEIVIERNTVKTLRFYERAVLQNCFVRPILAFAAAYLQLCQGYKDGDWSLNRGYIYITILNSISAISATYGLFGFLRTAKGMMKTNNVLLKYIMVYLIVFGTYWQGVLLAVFEEAITGEVSTDPGTVAAKYNNWLIGVEMLPTAIAMRFAFPLKPCASDEYTVEYGVKQTPPEPEVVVFKSSTDSLYPLL